MYLHRYVFDVSYVIDCNTLSKTVSKITEKASVCMKKISPPLTSIPQTKTSSFFKENTKQYHSTDKDSFKIIARQINGGDLPVKQQTAQQKLYDSLSYST